MTLAAQNKLVLARLTDLEAAVRAGVGDTAPAAPGRPLSSRRGGGDAERLVDAAAPGRPLRQAARLVDQLRAELEAARARVGEHESMMKLLQQKNTSLATKLEVEQAEAVRLRKAHEKLRRASDRARSELDAERAETARLRTRLAAFAAAAEITPQPPPIAVASTGVAPTAGAAVAARRLAADREFAALAAAAPPAAITVLSACVSPHTAAAAAAFSAPPFVPSPPAVVRPPSLAAPRPPFDPRAFTGALTRPSVSTFPGTVQPFAPAVTASPPPTTVPPTSAATDVLGAFVVPDPTKGPFCPARHAAEEDEFGAIAGRTATQ